MTGGRRGSVTQEANGTWSFVVDTKDQEGRRRQTRRRGFSTRRAAQAELTRVLTSIADNAYVAPQVGTLAAFLTETWLPAVERTVKPSTFESYRRNVRLHAAGRGIGRRKLQDVDPTDLNGLYSELLAGDSEHRALSNRSVAYVASILHRALRDAVRWQLIVRNPADAADPPRVTARPTMTTWSASELRTFLDGIDDDRLAGAWWLLASTGMRRGEVLGLRWQDIDLDGGVLRITRTLITTDVQRKGDPGMAWGTPKTAKGAAAWPSTTRRSQLSGPTAHASCRNGSHSAVTTTTETSSCAGRTGVRFTPRRCPTTSSRPPSGSGYPRSDSTTSGTHTPPSRSGPASIHESCRSASATRTSASPSTRTPMSTSRCRRMLPRRSPRW